MKLSQEHLDELAYRICDPEAYHLYRDGLLIMRLEELDPEFVGGVLEHEKINNARLWFA